MRAGLALALLAAIGGCAAARHGEEKAPSVDQADLTCTFAHPARSVNALKDLPPVVRAYIAKSVHEIADQGAFFNAGDVVMRPAPFNRFIRGGEAGGKLFLWYEHGGFAYWKQIVLLNADGSVFAERHASGDATLCAQTDALLDGGS